MSWILILHSILSLSLTISARPDRSARPFHELPSDEFWLHEKVTKMPDLKLGPFARLDDGSILTVNEINCYRSTDEGQSWKATPIFEDASEFLIRPERALIRTRKGTIILAFANDKERANWDWQEDVHDSPGAVLPTYAIRSTDNGKTWEAPQKLHDEWTGAIRDMIETSEGNIVFTSMMMQHSPGRHAVVTYTSGDEGKSWTRSNVIDLGGIGHHAGVTEATIEQLEDGRLWMLLRTNWGVFWQAFSDDQGLTWNKYDATDIDASSAPGLLKRLQSGRLVLVWNRKFPQGQNSYPLRGGDGNWSEVPISNHRQELSIMFSEDDGKSWTKAVVIAKNKTERGRVSYPYIFEAWPGELWITVWQGNLRIKLHEEDFLFKRLPSNEALASPQIALELPPGNDNPRNSEGDFIQLKDGRLWFVYTHYYGTSSSDHATAYLAARSSSDGGLTWSDTNRVILPNEGEMNIMSVSLLRLKNGKIALFYLQKNSLQDCIPIMRTSDDEGESWSDPVPCIPDKQGYFVLNNDRVIQLDNGRLLLAVARHSAPGEEWSREGRLYCYYSDDSGATWKSSEEVPNPQAILLQEPGLVTLKDGTIMMFIRSDIGTQSFSYSKDDGLTWTPVTKSQLISPISPATIERIPQTGDLVAIWNNNLSVDVEVAKQRTPLTIAISKDEGQSWEKIKNLEDDPDGWYCYTAIHFDGNQLFAGFCAGSQSEGTRLNITSIKRIPLSWIYK